jgi:hypothetical protein
VIAADQGKQVYAYNGGEMMEGLLKEDRVEDPAITTEGNWCVEREVVALFKDHPYLLVSDARLASLLCRPLEMVEEAVAALENAGFLARKDGETLLCTEDYILGVTAD